jgi:hypothetical protein
VVEEYTLDASLLRELRELEDLAARELGQREHREDATPGPVVLSQVLITSREEARAYLARFNAEGGASPVRPASPSSPPLSLPTLADALAEANAEDREENYSGPEGL